MPWKEIDSNVFLIFLPHWDATYFESFAPLRKGTSYNCYVVRGSEKVALIDTAAEIKSNELIKVLEEIGINRIDYVVANHAEQDHTGVLREIVEHFGATIVCNMLCSKLIKEEFPELRDKDFKIINNNETLSLGDKTLRFIFAPYVHWPETMFTYLEEQKVLFTCDFLGSHIATSNPLNVSSDELVQGMIKYYAEIMQPYKEYVNRYVYMIRDKIRPNIIAPSHGAVHVSKERIDFVLNLHEEWSNKQKSNGKILVVYLTMYGASKEIADVVMDEIIKGGKEVIVRDVLNNTFDVIIEDAVNVEGIIFIGPSFIDGTLHPLLHHVVYSLSALKPKAKLITGIISYGWGTHADDTLKEVLEKRKLPVYEVLKITGKADENEKEMIRNHVRAYMEKLKNI